MRVLGEDLTVYRDEASRVRVVGGRCAHRGTFLHTGWVEGDCIRCFYHGWKFDPTGACVEQPAEQAGFATAAHIAAYHGEEYAGLVFVYLGPGDPPALPRYPELDAPGVKVVAGIRPPGPWPMNYFQALENNVDPVHLSFVHRATEPFTREVPEVRAERVAQGISMTAIRGGVARSTTYWFPQMIQLPLYLIPGDRTEFAFFNWVVPVDDTHTVFVAATAIPEDLADARAARHRGPHHGGLGGGRAHVRRAPARQRHRGGLRRDGRPGHGRRPCVGAARPVRRRHRRAPAPVARAPRRPRLTRPNTRGGLLTTST